MHALTTDHTQDRLVRRVRGLRQAPVALTAMPFLVIMAVVAAAVSTGMWWSGLTGAVIGAVCGLAAWAAVVDVRELRLPDRLVAGAALPVLLFAGVAVVRGEAGVVGQILLGAAVVALPLLVLHVISPVSLGFGDVKLGAVLGAALGLVDPRLGLVALCIASGGTVAVAAVLRRRALPFGPGLVLGTTGAFVVAGLIGMETLTWR